MPTIRVHSELTYDVRAASTMVLKISAAATERQTVHQESLRFNPQLPVRSSQTDLENNTIHRLTVQPCQFEIAYQADVTTALPQPHASPPPECDTDQIPPEVLPYLNPSRYCESDLLGQFAVDQFSGMSPGYGRVASICDWVNQQLDYVAGTTGPTTTAADVLLQRTGVCRDYAHVAISLCRGLGIPARYVSGYAVGLQPPDFHGFLEVYLGGDWYFFDPTKLSRDDGLVRIATGRDAADVAFATITGNAMMTAKMVSAVFADG